MKRINQYTLFLAIVVLLSIMFFSSHATSLIPMLILLIISTLIALFSLFLIHHPTLQIRLSIYNTIILIALQIWLFIYFNSLKISDIFPIISAILSATSATLIRKEVLTSQVEELLGKYGKKRKRTKKN